MSKVIRSGLIAVLASCLGLRYDIWERLPAPISKYLRQFASRPKLITIVADVPDLLEWGHARFACHANLAFPAVCPAAALQTRAKISANSPANCRWNNCTTAGGGCIEEKSLRHSRFLQKTLNDFL